MRTLYDLPPGVDPHPYQTDALRAIDLDIREYDFIYILMPTGTGKTVVAGFYARSVIESGGRVLFVAHMDELITQGIRTFEWLGIPTAREQAGYKASEQMQAARMDLFDRRDIRCVVGSVRSMRKGRLARWARDSFDLVIVDECHHILGDDYQGILSHFRSARVLGLTGYDRRGDRRNIRESLPRKSYEYPGQTAGAIRDGWLKRPYFTRAREPIELGSIDIDPSGDFNPDQLADALSPQFGRIANAIREKIGDRIGLAFAPKVASAFTLANSLNAVGISARATSGRDPDRDDAIRDFRSGLFQVLCTCGVGVEGFDHPPASFVSLSRPTRSAPLLGQMVGRVLRRHPGMPDAVLLDFAWQLDTLRPLDYFDLILPPGTDARRVQRARDRSISPVDILAAIDTAAQDARETIDDEESLLRARSARDSLALPVTVRSGPSGLEFMTGELVSAFVPSANPDPDDSSGPRTMLSDGQRRMLASYGLSPDESRYYSRRKASQVIDWLVQRDRDGMATLPQCERLARLGWNLRDAWTLTRDEANRAERGHDPDVHIIRAG